MWVLAMILNVHTNLDHTIQIHTRRQQAQYWRLHYGMHTKRRWHNKIIHSGNVWDATKGYRGEGPPDRRGKKRQNSTVRGDKRYFNTLKMWGNIPKTIMREIGEENTVGHDLWYENEASLTWNKLQNNVVSLNMAGWGQDLERRMLLANLAKTKTMVVVLQDHRRTTQQIQNMQYEIEETWLGERTGNKAAWAHAPASSNRIGGVTIAIHPALARYAKHEDKWYDQRGWGRWTAITLVGRKRNTVIIGTYGPTPNDNEDSENAMWQKQLREMRKLPAEEQATDPRAQYMFDMKNMLNRLKKEKRHVILAGDLNINMNKEGKEREQWNDMISNNSLENTMLTWWPMKRHKFVTWGGKSWIDHIYMSNDMIKTGCLIQAGIEKGKTFYKSDHNMIG